MQAGDPHTPLALPVCSSTSGAVAHLESPVLPPPGHPPSPQPPALCWGAEGPGAPWHGALGGRGPRGAGAAVQCPRLTRPR